MTAFGASDDNARREGSDSDSRGGLRFPWRRSLRPRSGPSSSEPSRPEPEEATRDASEPLAETRSLPTVPAAPERPQTRPGSAGDTPEPTSLPEVGPQTAAINLNQHNPVQDNVYGSPESRRAFRDLESLLLGGERSMNRKDAAHAGGLSILNARKIWRAMGFPNLRAEEIYFTHQDSEALGRISELVKEGELTEEAALSLVRAMAQMTDRMVVWQVEAMAEDLVVNSGYSDPAARQELLRILPRLTPALEELLVYSWRRQLNGAVQRLAMRQERPEDSPDAQRDGDASGTLPLARGIGFADMVSYTSLSRQMNERTLAALVQRFEQRCAEVIAVGRGRLIKTIGDEVMFMAETPQDGALMALALAEVIREDEELPQCRVAFVWGRVLPRLGDLYGPTVNLASRLVALTPPGGVLVDASTASVLADDDRFVLETQPPQSVRGFGDVRPVALSAGPGPQLEVDYV